MRFSLDFQVFKKGGTEPIIASRHSVFHLRSVNAEATLDGGDYVVHVRVDSEIIRGAVSSHSIFADAVDSFREVGW